jgi:hypothetical protein
VAQDIPKHKRAIEQTIRAAIANSTADISGTQEASLDSSSILSSPDSISAAYTNENYCWASPSLKAIKMSGSRQIHSEPTDVLRGKSAVCGLNGPPPDAARRCPPTFKSSIAFQVRQSLFSRRIRKKHRKTNIVRQGGIPLGIIAVKEERQGQVPVLKLYDSFGPVVVRSATGTDLIAANYRATLAVLYSHARKVAGSAAASFLRPDNPRSRYWHLPDSSVRSMRFRSCSFMA